jgi:hypothetical protein
MNKQRRPLIDPWAFIGIASVMLFVAVLFMGLTNDQ